MNEQIQAIIGEDDILPFSTQLNGFFTRLSMQEAMMLRNALRAEQRERARLILEGFKESK